MVDNRPSAPEVFEEEVRKAFALIAAHPMVGAIRGAGLFWGIELVRERATREPFPPALRATNRVLAAAMRRGLFVYPATGMAEERGGDGLMVTPPFVIGEAEIEFIADALRGALDEVGPRLSAESGNG